MHDPSMPAADAAVQAQLAKLKKKYGLGLPEKIAGIEAAAGPVFAAPWSEPVLAASYRQVHSLAGSSGTYGFPELTGVARAAEAILRAGLDARETPAADQKARFDDLMSTLRELAAAAARQCAA
jgi:HPt (histidine-containing phosphotransfer) domain-containing protein